MKKIMNKVCVLFGFLFFGIGVIGVILPMLPTTPFLLLAAFLFAKGSERFHTWLLSTKLYRTHINNVVKKREMTVKAKISVLFTISLMLLFAFLVVPIWHAKVVIVIVAMIHYYYFLFRIRTIKTDDDVAVD